MQVFRPSVCRIRLTLTNAGAGVFAGVFAKRIRRRIRQAYSLGVFAGRIRLAYSPGVFAWRIRQAYSPGVFAWRIRLPYSPAYSPAVFAAVFASVFDPSSPRVQLNWSIGLPGAFFLSKPIVFASSS